MAAKFSADWPTCQRVLDPPCPGRQVPGLDACLAHLTEEERHVYLMRLVPGEDLDARGTIISATLLSRLLDAMRDADGAVVLGRVRFDYADIDGAGFGGVRFNREASFDYARFSGVARFSEAWFGEAALFNGTQFEGGAEFLGTRFDGFTSFAGTRWHNNAGFAQAQFADSVSFSSAEVEGTLDFGDANFADAIDIGLVRASFLRMTGAHFKQSVQIDADAIDVDCSNARFDGGIVLAVRYAKIEAIRTVFGAPSSIASPAERHRITWTSAPDWAVAMDLGDQAKLLTLHDTDVSNLVLVSIDLSRCAFTGAHRLDQLRIEGRCEFATPAGWRCTNRQVLAEEAYWRGWPVGWLNVGKATPEWLAAVYRSLRKALEDSKNEAGAGDFYYGEMEMRRHSAKTRRAERWILSLYWLISGYGQRGGRALTALLVLIATVGVLLVGFGQPVGEAAKIAVGAVVLREAGTELTTAGEWTVMAARFLGPVLLALAVLAVRARVKR